ncbi:hypothetical protein Tco_0276835 [Tanacetum coccineum]
MVNENNSNIIFDIPNMDPDRNKEEHDYVEYEKHHAFFASLINNLKCDVEKCNEIKLLNDKISYLKSQACEKDKTFAKENEKYDEYVQPLLNRKNELEKKNQEFLKQINDLDNKLQKVGKSNQTLRMLLPKEDNVNTGKQGLGFENHNDYVNPSLLNKAKDLAPCLYSIDEMGKDELSDHKIISEEELKYEAEKCLKVKQRKSPLSYHGVVYAETQFEEPLKVPLKRRNINVKEHLEQVQLRNYDPKLWNSLLMKYFCYVKQAMLKFEKQTFSKLELNRDDLFRISFKQSVNERSLVKEMKDDLEYVMSLEDEFDETCLLLDIQQEFFKTQFESAISELHSYVFENEMFEQNSSLENENCCLKMTISQIQKDFSKMETQKDFKDAKVDFSKKTDKFETYFEKLEKTKVVLERQLDRKIQDSNAEKD